MAGHAAALALARSLGLGFMVTGLALLAAAAAAFDTKRYSIETTEMPSAK